MKQDLTTAVHTPSEGMSVNAPNLYAVAAIGSNWGGATAILEYSPDNTNWFAVTGCSWTANGYAPKELPAGKYRGRLSVVGTGAIVSVIIGPPA